MSWPMYQDPYYNKDYLDALLANKSMHALWRAFKWDSTPQGHNYWYRRMREESKMNPDDWAYVRFVKYCVEFREASRT